MTRIEQKVQLIRRYIIDKKGVDINDIILHSEIDLIKLDYAFKYALKYFNNIG